MRFLLPLLVLVGLMAAAGAWQGRWTDDMRRQRDLLLGRIQPAEPAARPTHVVIGRPSGQAPFDVPWELPRETAPTPTVAPPTRAGGGVMLEPEIVPEAAAPWEPVFEVEVRPGKVLSVLCQEFYGTSRPIVVQRVAEWNRLASPDHLKAGQLLELPARAWILDGLP